MTLPDTFRFLRVAVLAPALWLAPAGAQAVTVTPLPITDRSVGSTVTGSANLTGTTMTFTWSGTSTVDERARFYIPFTIDQNFSLELTSYASADPRQSAFNLIQGNVSSGNPGDVTLLGADEVGTLLEGLHAAGTYTLRFNEGGRPDSGTATFEIVPVPLPAALALMLTALGGLILLHRRSS